jgi:hypothetical protein
MDCVSILILAEMGYYLFKQNKSKPNANRKDFHAGRCRCRRNRWRRNR